MKKINTKTTSILFVEDEKIIREELCEFISQFCDKLYLAKNGKEGLEKYIKHKPDIVISDIKMPLLNGIEMASMIKNINKKSHIIFTTAFSDPDFLQKAIELQVDGYLIKPLKLTIFKNLIEKCNKIINLRKSYKEQEVILNEIAMLQDNILIVKSAEDKILFGNKTFVDFMGIESYEDFYSHCKCLCELFKKHKDYFHTEEKLDKNWINKIEYLEDNKRVVLLMNIEKTKAVPYLVSIKRINQTCHTIISLVTIPSLIYEKNELQLKSTKDELTSIYNRRFFNISLKEHIKKYHQENLFFSLIMFDIDNFKLVNDSYGHQVGDLVLVELVKLIKSYIRATDIFARWGGEEFIILLSGSTSEYSFDIANKLRKYVENNNFSVVKNITCSFGVTQFIDNDNEETLLNRVDQALYSVKNNGKNDVILK